MSHYDTVKILDRLIEAEEENLTRRKRDFDEISDSLNRAIRNSEDQRIQILFELKNIARANYRNGGETLNKLKRRRAELTG